MSRRWPVADGQGGGPLVVVGDSFLDVDVEGEATRLCPDAPVPVLDLGSRRRRPGGAGLAALLAAADGAEVVLVTALGHDDDAETLSNLLADHVRVVPLPLAGTTVSKTRFAASEVPLLRVDAGTGRAADAPLVPAVREALREAGAVLVADYGLGVTSVVELRSELESAAQRIPVVWDPHPRGSDPVPGCRLVTPNQGEAAHFGGGDDPAGSGDRLLTRWGADAVAVTVGARGAVVTQRSTDARRPLSSIVGVPPGTNRAHSGPPSGRRIDTCGAGDRFAAAAALGLREGANIQTAVAEAVAAASRFVWNGAAGSVGVSVQDDGAYGGGSRALDAFSLADRVRRLGGRLVATGGCFDLVHPGHIELLEAARALGDALVVCLNSDASVRRAKGPERPLVGQVDRTRVLQALGAVDAVAVFEEDTPAEILAILRPDVWVKGGDYEGQSLPEAEVVQSYGGQVALVPLAPGYSTTSLVHNARRLSPVSEFNNPVSLEVS